MGVAASKKHSTCKCSTKSQNSVNAGQNRCAPKVRSGPDRVNVILIPIDLQIKIFQKFQLCHYFLHYWPNEPSLRYLNTDVQTTDHKQTIDGHGWLHRTPSDKLGSHMERKSDLKYTTNLHQIKKNWNSWFFPNFPIFPKKLRWKFLN